jgi:hypothetical protein
VNLEDLYTVSYASTLPTKCAYTPLSQVPGELVRDALETDKKFRVKGVREGLVNLNSIYAAQPTRQDLDYDDMPILRMNILDVAYSKYTLVDAKLFARKYNALFGGIMAGFDLKRFRMHVAGGCPEVLARSYEDQDIPIDDIDMFLVGHTPQTADIAIKALGDYLYYTLRNLRVFRTNNCITFMGVARGYTPVKIQIIRRLYDTISEVIHGFDLGSCSILYTGSDVWLTKLGQVALEYNLNILNMDVRRGSYEKRIAKKCNKLGLSVALPGLDIGLVSAGTKKALFIDTTCKFELLLYQITRKAVVETFSKRVDLAVAPMEDADDTVQIEYTAETSTSCYDFGLNYNSYDSILLTNIYAVVHNNNKSICGMQYYSPYCDINAIRPTFNSDLSSLFEQLHRRKNWEEQFHKILGPYSAELVELYKLGDQRFNASNYHNAYSSLQTKLQKALDAISKIEPYMGVEEATSLTGPFERNVLALWAWFGSYYMAGSPASSAPEPQQPAFSSSVAPVVAQVPAPEVAQVPAPEVAQVPATEVAPVVAQVPAPEVAQVQAPVAAQVPAPVAAQVPAPVAAQVPAPVAAQVPAPVAAQVPAPVAAQVPAPVAAQVIASPLVDHIENSYDILPDTYPTNVQPACVCQ